MCPKLASCTVVEVSADTSAGENDPTLAPRELLPWADPYIAQLLVRHRLQAALDDSLAFVTNRATGSLGSL